MSFLVQPPPPPLPNRCQLFVPGVRPELFEKAAAGKADVINLDNEDSVPPGKKAESRANIIQGINEVDWGRKTLSMRINPLDGPFWHKDVVEVMEQTNGRLDRIMIPKVGNPSDIYAVDCLVSAIEAAKGREKRLALEVIIETAAGIVNVEAIAQSSPRLQAMSIGAADFAASMGMQTVGIGGTQGGYYMIENPRADGGERGVHYPDPWHMATVRIVAACRANGILPVDGPFGDFSDDAGFKAQARRVSTLGMVGKWAIHPKQVALANEVFTPTDEAVAEARAILAAMAEAKEKGMGAATLNGKLVDIASEAQARVILRQIELING